MAFPGPWPFVRIPKECHPWDGGGKANPHQRREKYHYLERRFSPRAGFRGWRYDRVTPGARAMNDSHRGPLLQRQRLVADIWTRLDCIRGDGGLSLAKSNGLANKWSDDAADGSGRG
jgi:hypothetical protein